MARNRFMVGLVLLTFFVISLLSNILGPIVPDIIRSFHVSLTAAGFLIFSFFIAYGIMSIPAGFVVERFGEKPVMISAFVAATLGSISFALFPRYEIAVASLFVIGAGMAALQVAINPLLRVAGGEEHFAFNEVLAQLLFGSASFLSPHIYSYLALNLSPGARTNNALLQTLRPIVPAALPWVSLTWIFSLIALAMIVVLWFARFPRVQHTADERPGTRQNVPAVSCGASSCGYILFRSLLTSAVSRAARTGSTQFLSQYHHFDPHTTGAHAVSWFWGLMTLGCLAGVFLLKLFDSRRVLIGAAIGALACLSLALFGGDKISLIAFPLVGLFASVMWPIVISLALNSVAEYHGSFAGILGTGIMVGAVIPAIIGQIGDHFGLEHQNCCFSI